MYRSAGALPPPAEKKNCTSCKTILGSKQKDLSWNCNNKRAILWLLQTVFFPSRSQIPWKQYLYYTFIFCPVFAVTSLTYSTFHSFSRLQKQGKSRGLTGTVAASLEEITEPFVTSLRAHCSNCSFFKRGFKVLSDFSQAWRVPRPAEKQITGFQKKKKKKIVRKCESSRCIPRFQR